MPVEVLVSFLANEMFIADFYVSRPKKLGLIIYVSDFNFHIVH